MSKKIILPPLFLNKIKLLLNDDYENFVESFNNAPPVSIRLNTFKPSGNFTHLEKIHWCNAGKYMKERPIFTMDPLFHAGAYYVQEASSMFLNTVINQIYKPSGAVKILDLCAAPGGKSTLILSHINDESLLIANETINSRVKKLKENIIKWGSCNCFITNNDPDDFKNLENFFDIVLVDAPCSGEGMFRKEYNAINEWSEKNIELCSLRQKRIVSSVINSIKPNGYIIYSTCTYTPEENEEIIKMILHQNDFTSVKINIDEKLNIVETESNVGSKKFYAYRFYPHKVKGEGFFIACLKKNSSEESVNNKKSYRLPAIKKIPISINNEISGWLKKPQQFDFFMKEEKIIALKKCHFQDYFILNDHLNLKLAGLNLGRIVDGKLIPSHDLALSTEVSDKIKSVELNTEQAIKFLKKQEFNIDKQLDKGWMLVTFKGHNLGWIKILNNRINNYFPTELRIIKDH